MIPDYEGMLEAVYRAALRPGDVAIDIGAHVGRHALPMARAVGSEGRVYAFEPLPSAYAQLREAITADDVGGSVVPHNVALGEEEGEATFVYVPDFPEYSGFRERQYHVDSLRRETITVSVHRLDSFVADIGAPRFIKVDAEGGELTILRGAVATIARCRPVVSFELGNASLVNYSYTAADYYDFFAELRYTLFSIFGIPLSRSEFIAAADEQCFWDYVAIPDTGSWPFGHGNIRVLISQIRTLHEALEYADGGDRVTDASAEKTAMKAGVAEAQLAHMQAQLGAMYASTSWRITAPLRYVSRLFRGR